jgi:hypothetical protein
MFHHAESSKSTMVVRTFKDFRALALIQTARVASFFVAVKFTLLCWRGVTHRYSAAVAVKFT